MAKKFSELRAGMTPVARARSDIKAQVMLAETPLNVLRQARGLSKKCLSTYCKVATVDSLEKH
jgi:hypothetical protein